MASIASTAAGIVHSGTPPLQGRSPSADQEPPAPPDGQRPDDADERHVERAGERELQDHIARRVVLTAKEDGGDDDRHEGRDNGGHGAQGSVGPVPRRCQGRSRVRGRVRFERGLRHTVRLMIFGASCAYRPRITTKDPR